MSGAVINIFESGPISKQSDLLSRQISESDHMLGNSSAPVTLLMYGAYECPFCVEGNEVVKKIRQHYKEKLRFVFRHFPQTNVHPHAEAAAEVAEAAGEQDKFWEMHETLFENYKRLDGEHLISYAEALRLDMTQFYRAITSRVFAARVRDDLLSGIESGVRGTPTYFINGVRHFGSGRFEALVEAIETTISREVNVERIQP